MTSNNSTAGAESFTNTSVEYFLLENNDDSHPAAAAAGSKESIISEILSPIPTDHESTSRRIYFDEELTSLKIPSYNRTPTTSGAGEELLSSSYRGGRGGGRSAAELSGLNYLNALTYIIHVLVWCVVGVWGLDGLVNTRWDVTKHYETLVLPTDWSANYLWIPVVVSEGVFAIAQLLPHYRSRPIVGATGYFFFYTALLQIAYTFLYCFGLFIFSFVAAVLALLSILSLLASQQYHGGSSITGSNPHRPGRGSWTEYLFFRLPFLLHLGWMILITVDHFSLLFRRYSGNTGLQVGTDIVSLGILLPVATYALYQSAGPDFVIPVVILWSYIGIACRLENPSNAMMELYGPVVIEAILVSTYFFAGAVGCCLIPCIVVVLAREFCTINVVELD